MLKKTLFNSILVFLFLIFFIQKGKSQTSLKNDEILPDLRITLERTVCFGDCVPYKLSINNEGRIIFEGYSNTKTKVKAEGTITQEQLKEIIAEFEKAKFFTLKDKYQDEEDGCTWLVTCHPSAIISIQINGEVKNIVHYLGCSAGNPTKILGELSSKIDKIVETKRWIGESK